VYIGYVDGAGNNGINLAGSAPYTSLTIDNPGIYNVQFSGQIEKVSSGGGGSSTINIWIEQDSGSGFSQIPASNTSLQVSTVSEPIVAAWNWFIKTINPNEQIRLMWETDNTNIQWTTGNKLTGGPDIPSVILTVQQVMNTQVGATGTQGSTGAQGATGPSQWINMNGLGLTGTGYTGIGVTGQDVLIYGNLLVTGGIDPTYLALTPQATAPLPDSLNPLWVDSTNGNALRSNNIYLDTIEQREFANAKHRYLIEQLQFSGTQSITANAGTERLKLNFNLPVKELFWVNQLNTIYNTNDLFNYSNTVDPVVTQGNIIASSQIYINGIERFSIRTGDYFRLIQPYFKHTRSPNNFVYIYSFSIKPEEHQPSGCSNFSKIDTKELFLNINPNMGGQQLRVYALNYNILRIYSGMGGIAFSN